jgi:hypothetical protein
LAFPAFVAYQEPERVLRRHNTLPSMPGIANPGGWCT